MDKASANDEYNNKKLTFEEIAPAWSKRLDKLMISKESFQNSDSIYSDINDYKKCIVGEAYGNSPSYVPYGTEKYCVRCIGLSRDFVYTIKVYDLGRLRDTKQKLTDHWNESHIDITKGLRGPFENTLP